MILMFRDVAPEFAHLQRGDITGAGLSGAPLASDIHLTSDGRFLYASERTSNTLAGYAVDLSNGRLTEVGKVGVPPTPRGFAIDPAGRHLLVLGETSAILTVLAIDQISGALNALRRYPTGNGPNWIEVLAVQE